MNNKMQRRKSVYATAIIAFLIFSIFLAAAPIASAAGAISLSPTVQAPGSTVTVSGLGFGVNQAVGIGFGAEVNVTSEVMTAAGSGTGPYTTNLAYWPIKPGTYRGKVYSVIGVVNSTSYSWENGNGTLSSDSNAFVNGTINYATGQTIAYYSINPSSFNITRTANYTRYQDNVTPAAGVTTAPIGGFIATITVPNVPDGVYTITAVDAQGNIATAPLTVTRGLMKLSSSTRAKGTSITVTGTGFGINQAVGIGFGKEVNVINETLAESGPYGVAGGPYYYHLSHLPVKPGTYRKSINITSTMWWAADVDMGNGRFNSTSPTLVNGTIDYVTGLITLHMTTPIPLTTHYINIANYTYYEYDVTPAAGVTTSASGTFSASITVPNVSDGVYAVTAVDAQGHIATATFTVANSGNGWDHTYGGTGGEQAMGDSLQTSDGGYAILGNTSSFGAGGSDMYLIKTNANGDKIWSKTYGGALNDSSGGLCSTSDGGFMLCGGTYSLGRVGNMDALLVKTNANGDIRWYSAYGGAGHDYALYVVQTSDGGYAFAGITDSFGTGNQDAWLVKVDANGNMQWQKTYGGAGVDWVHHMVLASSGYALAGYTNSSGAGGMDFWLIKADASGNMQWNQTYGGAGIDQAYTVVATSDGGYALAGYTTTFGLWKVYLVKTDASGTMQWNKTYGGLTGIDIGVYLIKTMDGGFAIAGWNYANGQDFTLTKTDANGNTEWRKSYGGGGEDNCFSLLQASDGGYVLTGETDSFGAGGKDIYLVKTNPLGVVPEGLTIGIMLLLSTVAVIVGTRYFRKRTKLESW